MKSIDAVYALQGQAQRIDPAAVTQASAEFLDQLRQVVEQRYTSPVGPADNDPSNLFAEVKVGGRTVAKIYNGGSVEMPNALGARLTGKLPDGQGQDLAGKRADTIARAVGGEVVMAKTALTQAQYEARPPRQFQLDRQAMMNDPEWQRLTAAIEGRRSHIQTLVETQIIASDGAAP